MIVSKDANPYLNIRLGPNGAKVGRAYPGTHLTIASVAKGWSQLVVKVGDNPVTSNLYVSNDYLIDETIPVPQPVGKVKLGLHVMANGNIAGAEAAQGCKFFMIMDNNMAAHQIKTAFPDAVVMVRRYIRNRIAPADMMNALEVYPESRLVYTGYNESDIVGTSVEAIKERAVFDLELARLIKAKAPNARYAAGTFSRGEPDVTNPTICNVIKSVYAPAFNSGLIDFDQHTYSQTKDLNQSDEDWLVRRWTKYFELCGFNPERINSIYSSETGLDNGAVKGFPALGVTQEDFAKWAEKFISVNTKPIVMNGKSYSGQFVGGAIFQIGGNGDPQWNAFDVTGYVNTLRRYY